MAVRPVLRYPDPVLKRPAESVGRIDEAARTVARDLVDTMRAAPATVGLAAPQIGESIRVFALDVGGHPKATMSHGLVVLFDPVVVESSDPEVAREGCLSVPDLTADVRRARRLVIGGLDAEGEELELAMDGFEARAALHELDHVDGLLILDRVDAPSQLFPRKIYR